MLRIFTGLLVSSLFVVLHMPDAHAAGKYPRWAGGSLQILGFDSTAYHRQGRPAIGDVKHVVTWKTGTWRFKSAKAAALFQSNPAAYTPRFGAYCTGGLSQQHVVNGNPMIWRMHKGKIYMFYARAGARRFDQNPDGVIAAARAYAMKVGIVEN